MATVTTQGAVCASCGQQVGVADAECGACGESPLLDGRYRLAAALGHGAFGTTWRATREADGLTLCIKELLYQRLASFEPERLFRREAAVLRQLSVPGVPRYVDDFTVVSGRTVSLCLAQELVDGQNLAEEVEGHRYREDEVLAILRELLGILGSLHTLSPPIVHRDVKPANVMRRRADGRLVLIDFGAVKDAVRDTIAGGPTVAGTIGYMAPEQLAGQATSASDLYGAGALAVALLSRRSPADLLDDAGRLAWAPHVAVRPATAALLTALLAPSPGDRPASAAEAIGWIDRITAPATAALRDDAPAPIIPWEPPAEDPAAATPEDRPPRVPWELRRGEPAGPHPDDDPFAPEASATREAPVGSKLIEPLSVGAVIVVALLIVVAILTYRTSSDTGGSPAVVDVPDGLLGLRMGMTPAEAKAALPEVAAGEPEAPEQVYYTGGDILSMGDPTALPGTRWTFRTQLSQQLAQCTLDFSVHGGLSRIRCVADAFTDRARHVATSETLLDQLLSRYGLGRDGCGTGDAMGPGTPVAGYQLDCTWQDEGGTLKVHSRFMEFGSYMPVVLPPTSELSVLLVSRAHDELVERIEDQARAAAERKREATRAARAAKEREERRRIEEAGGVGRPL